MSQVEDLRKPGTSSSVVNRKRFLARAKRQIGDAVRDAIKNRKVTDIENGEEIKISPHDISEPVIGHGRGGRRDIVLPGNQEFIEGDEVPRPSGGGSGGSGGSASDSGSGEDDFVFSLSREEFLEFFFEDMELPNLVKTTLCNVEEYQRRRAGFTTSGVPVQLDLQNTMRKAKGRKIALSSKKRKRLEELRNELQTLLADPSVEENNERVLAIRLEIASLIGKIKRVRFLEELDQVYRNYRLEPKPVSRAVMFCIMDVSGSMEQKHKDLAKRFFILLYMFLTRNYEHIDIVYIRHHSDAKEVDHDEFFFSKETGGTVVSTALRLLLEIIKERYESGYNLYVAQASDGDNWQSDSPKCQELLRESIMPLVGYFAYVELVETKPQDLWKAYKEIQKDFPNKMGVQRILGPTDVYPALHELFQRKMA